MEIFSVEGKQFYVLPVSNARSMDLAHNGVDPKQIGSESDLMSLSGFDKDMIRHACQSKNDAQSRYLLINALIMFAMNVDEIDLFMGWAVTIVYDAIDDTLTISGSDFHRLPDIDNRLPAEYFRDLEAILFHPLSLSKDRGERVKSALSMPPELILALRQCLSKLPPLATQTLKEKRLIANTVDAAMNEIRRQRKELQGDQSKIREYEALGHELMLLEVNGLETLFSN